jgi:hypothetical protein
MPRHVYSVVSVGTIIFVSALVIPGTNGRVIAGNECFEQPSRESAHGEHWYYRYDREKKQKCWHLEAGATKTPEIALPPLKDQSDAIVPPTPNLDSVFSALFKRGRTAPSVPQDAAPGEPRIIQSNPTKTLTEEDIAQQQPDIPEERAEPRYVTPLTPAQRQALFEEYLRWEEIQRNLGLLGVPARSP